ncbi:MAG: PAS domain S-box protein [Sphingobacteriaceae bacterium]
MKNIDLKGKSEEEILALIRSYKTRLETEKCYHVILDNMKEGIQLVDFDFRYLYVNNSLIQQSKLAKEQLLGYTMLECFPEVEHSRIYQILKHCMDSRTSKRVENEFHYPDGSSVWFKLSIQPVPEGLFILSMDISERKQIEHEREFHVQEIEQLLFKISHEVRQPVCHMLGISNLLDKSLINPEEVEMIVSSIKGAVNQLDVYTKELTEFVSGMKMNAESEENYPLYPPGNKTT